MASFKDLSLDWSMLPEDITTWDLEDLQLAAQLAKSFLKRNEELVEDVSNLQKFFDDKQNEAEYFKRQTIDLRETCNVYHSRIFELDAKVEDLINVKDKLNAEIKNKTNQNYKLLENIQILNQRCEDLECNLEKVGRERDDLLKISLREQKEIKEDLKTYSASKTSESEETVLFQESIEEYSPKILSEDVSLDTIKNETSDPNEEFIRGLASVLRSEKGQRIRVEQRLADLEEQISTLFKENKRLKRIISANNELLETQFYARNMYLEEVNTLDEVSLELCSQCWQIVKGNVNRSSLQTADEYNEMSIESPDISIKKEVPRYTSSLLVQIGENGEIIG